MFSTTPAAQVSAASAPELAMIEASSDWLYTLFELRMQTRPSKRGSTRSS